MAQSSGGSGVIRWISSHQVDQVAQSAGVCVRLDHVTFAVAGSSLPSGRIRRPALARSASVPLSLGHHTT